MPAPDLKDINPKDLARELAEKTRQVVGQWEFALTPEGEPPWFNGYELAPPFDPSTDTFLPGNAWWLSELCRLVYTPDDKESDRPWHRDKPPRFEYLEKRSPFEEEHSIHKTGNHAAVYTARSKNSEPFTVLCFRGTNKLRQWIMNLTAAPVDWDETGKDIDPEENEPSPCVHQGFKILFDRVWSEIEPCLADTKGPLIFAGHSLGGAFATMAAAKRPPSALYTFGSPRVGNKAFCQLLDGVPHHRIVNDVDIVPTLPERDEKHGEREFQHDGSPVHLRDSRGDSPVESGQTRPTADCEESEGSLPDLKKSFSSPYPPEFIMDHAPSSYSAKLLEMIANS